jgi:hypothetical protein
MRQHDPHGQKTCTSYRLNRNLELEFNSYPQEAQP